MGKSKRNKAKRLDPIALANAEVRAAEQTLLAKRQAAARAAALAVNGQASPEEQYAEFLNRPGDYYVAQFEVRTAGEPVRAECVLKADEEQMPYLVEVIRQIRGAFGEHARIVLSRAQTTQQATRPPADNGLGRQRRRAEEDLAAARMAPVAGYPNTLPVDAFERMAADLLPDEMQPDIPELSREELQQQLPGMTRREVADELGVDPAEIGGDIKGADALDVEALAAELGVSPLDLMPIKGADGSTVYAVKPGAGRPAPGRHAAPDADTSDAPFIW